ncbi:hypothetical protein A9Q86_13815 [Flavobacteriales bacterium 33_180_T64]|nr:hypothetical protein A9Q86_13815 [Flavobacteriales bacterium 33_180_T64]
MGEETNQIVLIFILSTIFVVFLAVVLILFLVIYQKRIVTQEHRLQKLENERQQSLLKATIEGQERERKRLAKDLHDGIGSLLSGLNLNLKFLKNKENPNSEQFTFLSEASKLVDEGIENVRTVSHNLMPATLENFGLISAMEESIKSFNRIQELDVDIATVHTPFKIPNTIALGLLRVFQELLQNTIKHANASMIRVTLTYVTDFIILDYRDNGNGFNEHNSEGIGIKNMQSRIQALDGIFYMNSKSKAGFIVNIEVPLKPKEHQV